jgi:predicted RNA binding protein YcfA (HicA-like mRNA interferase family)
MGNLPVLKPQEVIRILETMGFLVRGSLFYQYSTKHRAQSAQPTKNKEQRTERSALFEMRRRRLVDFPH